MPSITSQYTDTEADLLKQLGGSSQGLSTATAGQLLRELGPNTVTTGGRRTVVTNLLDRCRNPLVIQLLVIAAVSYLMGDLRSTVVVGAMDVLCTDKTGTLTQDHVVLERYVDVTNRSSEDVLRYAYMNSFYQTGLRNLLDRAILAHSELDVERNCRKVDEIPFDFKRPPIRTGESFTSARPLAPLPDRPRRLPPVEDKVLWGRSQTRLPNKHRWIAAAARRPSRTA